MEDKQIIDLFFERSERAIKETDLKYGRYCHYIAYRVLSNDEDASEIKNDTYLAAWNSIPPTRPNSFKHYLGTLCRNLSINRYLESKNRSQADQISLALDELEECIPDTAGGEDLADSLALEDALCRFVRELPKETQKAFVMRYWYNCRIDEIARELSSKESKIKMMLLRTREKLKKFLESEGFSV